MSKKSFNVASSWGKMIGSRTIERGKAAIITTSSRMAVRIRVRFTIAAPGAASITDRACIADALDGDSFRFCHTFFAEVTV